MRLSAREEAPIGSAMLGSGVLLQIFIIEEMVQRSRWNRTQSYVESFVRMTFLHIPTLNVNWELTL